MSSFYKLCKKCRRSEPKVKFTKGYAKCNECRYLEEKERKEVSETIKKRSELDEIKIQLAECKDLNESQLLQIRNLTQESALIKTFIEEKDLELVKYKDVNKSLVQESSLLKRSIEEKHLELVKSKDLIESLVQESSLLKRSIEEKDVNIKRKDEELVKFKDLVESQKSELSLTKKTMEEKDIEIKRKDNNLVLEETISNLNKEIGEHKERITILVSEAKEQQQFKDTIKDLENKVYVLSRETKEQNETIRELRSKNRRLLTENSNLKIEALKKYILEINVEDKIDS